MAALRFAPPLRHANHTLAIIRLPAELPSRGKKKEVVLYSTRVARISIAVSNIEIPSS